MARTGENVGILKRREGSYPDDQCWLIESGAVFEFGEARHAFAVIDGQTTKVYRSWADYCDD